jgi:hypothetical protein
MVQTLTDFSQLFNFGGAKKRGVRGVGTAGAKSRKCNSGKVLVNYTSKSGHNKTMCRVKCKKGLKRNPLGTCNITGRSNLFNKLNVSRQVHLGPRPLICKPGYYVNNKGLCKKSKTRKSKK